MQSVVRFEGVVDKLLTQMIKQGYYKTKTEALRAGVLELADRYGLLPHQRHADEMASRKMDKIDAEIKAGKRKLISLDDTLKQAGISRDEM